MDSENPSQTPQSISTPEENKTSRDFDGEKQDSPEFWQMFLILYLPFLILGVAVVIVVFFL